MTTHIEDDRAAFRTMPKPPRIPVRNPGQLSRFAVWAWSPIMSFQVGLTAGYAALAYFGVASIIATPPSIEATTPEGYGGFWAMALIIGAFMSAGGSIAPQTWLRRIETIGASLLSLTVGSYAAILSWFSVALGDLDKLAAGAGFTALAVPIIIRTMWLYSQLLRK